MYSPCRSGTRRAACPAGRRLNLPHHEFFAPIPPTPLPSGKGEPQSLFRRGLRPRHPCTEPPAALTDRAVSGTRRAACPSGRRVNLPHHRFIAPIPPTPLPGGKGETKVILCKGLRPLHPRHQTAGGTYRPCRTGARRLNPGGITRREPLSFGFEANHGFNPGDARGEAPCIRKLKFSPFPTGEGGRGDRGKKPMTRQKHPATKAATPPHPPSPQPKKPQTDGNNP